MEKLQGLCFGLIDIMDNPALRGRTRFNLIGRAIAEIVRFVTRTDMSEDARNEALAIIQETQDALGGQAWRLNKATDRIMMFNPKHPVVKLATD